MGEQIYKIIEVDEQDANKLLDTGCFKLLDTYKKATYDEMFPQDTTMMYSLGQTCLGKCSLCGAKDNFSFTVEYSRKNLGTKVKLFGKCRQCSSEHEL